MKLFETLVEQGQNLESRTKRAASETATAAAGMAAQKAKEMQAMAGGTWDKLEQVFEDRVARALSKLGVHTQSRRRAALAARRGAVGGGQRADQGAGRPAGRAVRAQRQGRQARAACPPAKPAAAARQREAGASAPRKRARKKAAG